MTVERVGQPTPIIATHYCHLEQANHYSKYFEHLLAGAERGLSQEGVQFPVSHTLLSSQASPPVQIYFGHQLAGEVRDLYYQERM